MKTKIEYQPHIGFQIEEVVEIPKIHAPFYLKRRKNRLFGKITSIDGHYINVMPFHAKWVAEFYPRELVRLYKLTKRDKEILKTVDQTAALSKDSTQVGAVITSESKEILITAWNSFPPSVKVNEKRTKRPDKYLYTEHAERYGIYTAGRVGMSLVDTLMYLRWFPCADCARAIVLSGIKELYCTFPDTTNETWGKSFVAALDILKESNIKLLFYK